MVTDARALSEVISALGGNPINDTWRFTLPLSEAKETIPRLRQATGLGVKQISQHTEHGPHVRTVCVLELYTPDETQRSWQIPNW
jgi:hypothetical protein